MNFRGLLGPTILAVIGAGCAPASLPTLGPGAATRAEPLRVQVAEAGGAVRRVAVEDYVRAAVISELTPTSGEPEHVARMLEVQAIIARTYALANRGRHARQGFDLCSTTHCQIYEPSRLKTSRWAGAAEAAVRRTAGAVVWHGNGPATAMFHADCGGHTSTSVSAWGGTPRPYLQAAPDDGPAEAAHSRWAYAVTIPEIAAALNTDPRTSVGARLEAIDILTRDASGRAATMRLRGAATRVVKGEDFRAVLSRRFGARAIRSTLFDLRSDAGRFVFEGRGFGHGVGLCQAGALARIRAGAAPADVVRRYYPGTTLAVVR